MAKQTINIGTTANDGTGDPLRTAFDKVNSNFTELYNDDTGDVNSIIAGDGISVDTATGNVTVTNTITNNNQLINGAGYVDGTGTANYIAKWTDGDTINNSVIYDNGTNVGIGTSIPNKALTIINNNEYQLRLANDDDAYSSAGIFLGEDISDPNYYGTIKWEQSSVSMKISSQHGNEAGGMVFETGVLSPVERMRITPYGNVGIGTSIPIDTLSLRKSVTGGTSSTFITFDRGRTDRYVAIGLNAGGTSNQNGLSFFTTNNLDVPTEKMVIDANGSVGIGTSSPAAKLDVQGDVIFNDPSASLSVKSSSVGGVYNIMDSATGVHSLQFDGGYYSIYDLAAGTERMRIDSSGNVGIGTSSPSAKMTVAGDISLYNSVPSGNETNNILFKNSIYEIAQIKAIVGAGQLNRGELAFNVDNGGGMGTAMYISRTRNVGIGMNTPTQRLQVYEGGLSSYKTYTFTDAGAILTSYQSQGSPFTKTTDLVAGSDGTVPSEIRLLTRASGSSAIAERMRIGSSGNVTIGLATASAKLNIIPSSDGFVSPYFQFLRTGTASQYASQFVANSVEVGSIKYTNTTTSYNTSSDYRLKEDWQPMANALDRVEALKPINFAWKADGSRVDGFLAHELAEVIPEAVTGEKDATEEYEIPAVLDEEGNVIEEATTGVRDVYQGIDQSKIVPLLVAAIQELKAEIELLKTK